MGVGKNTRYQMISISSTVSDTEIAQYRPAVIIIMIDNNRRLGGLKNTK